MGRGLYVLVWMLLTAGCGRIAFDGRDDASGAVDDGSSTADAPVDLTLLLHFSFEQGLVIDDSGGNDATCTSCPTITNGRVGRQAALFDGSTTCLSIPLPLPERPAVGMTAAAWVRIDSAGTQTIFGAPYDTIAPTQNSFEIYTAASAMTTIHINNDASITMATNATEWHHVALVWNGGMMESYLDGAAGNLIGSSGPMWSAENLTIGCDIDNSAGIDFFDGAVDDVRLYSRALDSSEIAALAQ